VLAATWKSAHGSGYHEQIAIVVDNVALYNLMSLAANEQASDEVRAIASLELHELKDWLVAEEKSAAAHRDSSEHGKAVAHRASANGASRGRREEAARGETAGGGTGGDFPERAHFFFAAQQIEQFEKDPKKVTVPGPQPPPDGPPIGTLADDDD
jgi:hypothetical protein